jgi:hypothetical protein
MGDQGKERREFERFSLTFDAEISAEDQQGNPYNDQVVLRNISGGGVGFKTHMAERYFQGQMVHISITLPASGEIKSTMQGRAQVVRLSAASDGEGLVGVVTPSPLRFGHNHGPGKGQ